VLVVVVFLQTGAPVSSAGRSAIAIVGAMAALLLLGFSINSLSLSVSYWRPALSSMTRSWSWRTSNVKSKKACPAGAAHAAWAK